LARSGHTQTTIYHHLTGTYQETVGSANSRDFSFENWTGEEICDFTVSIKSADGTDITAKIKSVSIADQSWVCDDDLSGTIDDSETDTEDSTPGHTCRIKEADGCISSPLPEATPTAADRHTMTITLDSFPDGEWTLTIQPTDRTGKAIARPLTSNDGTGSGKLAPDFHGIGLYEITMDDEPALIAPYTGISFSDLNMSGQDLLSIYLLGSNFPILDAMQCDPLGNPIPGSLFDAATGQLTLPAPIPIGAPFYLSVVPANYVPGVMRVMASLQYRTDAPPVLSRGEYLRSVHPNPFNPRTTIEYNLPVAMPMRLSIVDAAGREVRVLHDGMAPAGPGSVTWDGRDGVGQKAASGLYLLQLTAGEHHETRKLSLIK
jgi:hypothetical protein